MNHTKEPWRISNELRSFIISYDGFSVRAIAKCFRPLNGEKEDFESNVERIVLCINQCAGITDEALKAGVITKAMSDLSIKINPDSPNDATFYGGMDRVNIWED